MCGSPYDTFRAEAVGAMYNREESMSCTSSQQSQAHNGEEGQGTMTHRD